RRKRARRPAEARERYLGHAQAPLEDRGGAVAPVVEIAGDDDRQVARGELFEPARDRLELPAAAARVQRQMNATAMQVGPPARDRDDAMQESAALVAMVRDILVLERQKTVARQDGVAVMAVVVHGVAAIDVLPRVAGEERVLRLGR